jgi:hypothetical protein
LQLGTRTDPHLSNDTIDSVVHREVGRAKDLSAPLRTSQQHFTVLSVLKDLENQLSANDNVQFFFLHHFPVMLTKLRGERQLRVTY